MSAEREELLRLIEHPAKEDVPAALADVRRHLRPAAGRPWPPPWFGAAEGRRTDTAARAEEPVEDGPGRSS